MRTDQTAIPGLTSLRPIDSIPPLRDNADIELVRPKVNARDGVTRSAGQGVLVHLQSQTAVAGVVEELRGRILSGALRPGMSLPPERELASELDVSRATLREGLSVLSQMGLLTISRGRAGGAVVTAPPATTVSASIALLFQTRVITSRQLAEFRRALEVEAAQLACARRSDRDLAHMAAALDAYMSCGSDARAQTIHGWEFHHAVARASGNPLLAETMSSLNEAYTEVFELRRDTPDEQDLIHAMHWPILDAIHRQDAAAAREAMLIHFDQLMEALSSAGLSERPIGAHAPGDAFGAEVEPPRLRAASAAGR